MILLDPRKRPCACTQTPISVWLASVPIVSVLRCLIANPLNHAICSKKITIGRYSSNCTVKYVRMSLHEKSTACDGEKSAASSVSGYISAENGDVIRSVQPSDVTASANPRDNVLHWCYSKYMQVWPRFQQLRRFSLCGGGGEARKSGEFDGVYWLYYGCS